jgi:hypothetical protein
MLAPFRRFLSQALLFFTLLLLLLLAVSVFFEKSASPLDWLAA